MNTKESIRQTISTQDNKKTKNTERLLQNFNEFNGLKFI